MEITPLLVSIPQSAQILGRGVSTIYNLLARGEIVAKRSDGRTLVVYKSLVAYRDRLPTATFAARRDKRPVRLREAEVAMSLSSGPLTGQRRSSSAISSAAPSARTNSSPAATVPGVLTVGQKS